MYNNEKERQTQEHIADISENTTKATDKITAVIRRFLFLNVF